MSVHVPNSLFGPNGAVPLLLLWSMTHQSIREERVRWSSGSVTCELQRPRKELAEFVSFQNALRGALT